MSTKRQQKFSRMIQRELGDILQKKGKDFVGNSFITLTKTEISPDLSVVKIYISILQKDGREEVLKALNIAKPEIRKILGNRIAKVVRHIPELVFIYDGNLDHAARIEEILSKEERYPSPPAEDEEA